MDDMSPAKWANRVTRACLREAGDDTDAGFAAAAFIVDAFNAGLVQPEQFVDDGAGMEATLSVLDEGLAKMRGARSAALSVLDDEDTRPTVGAWLYGAGIATESCRRNCASRSGG
jgi:hypothetical protein